MWSFWSETVSGGKYILHCHRSILGELISTRRGCEYLPLVFTYISPFAKQTDVECRFLAPFNLFLGIQKNAPVSLAWRKVLVVCWLFSRDGWFPVVPAVAFTSNLQALDLDLLSTLFQAHCGTGIWLILSPLIQSWSVRVNIAKIQNPTKSVSKRRLSSTHNVPSCNVQ